MDEGSDVIELNVGGERMATLRSTLCQVEGSLLASMFSGRWEDSMSHDKEGRIFLNFDPKYFALILGHLRAKEISTPDNPPKLPNVPFKKDKNFHLLVEYLGLTKEVFPELPECFKEHSQGMQLEENGTTAVFHSSKIAQQETLYSLPNNEFLFGKNVYEEGTIRLGLEFDIKFASYVHSDFLGSILVGVVPPTVLTRHVQNIRPSQSKYFYGHEMSIQGNGRISINSDQWQLYETPTTIELVLDCDNGMLYFIFEDGSKLDLKLSVACNKWKLFFKLDTPKHQIEQPMHVRVAITEYVIEY